MSAITLQSEHFRARVLPALGAGLAAFDARGPDGQWHAIMRNADAEPTWFNDLACYFLAPWSNRIAAGRFVWRGREVRLAPDWPDGTAIHGLVKDKAWRLVERTPVSAVLTMRSENHVLAGWPWPFRCLARYEILEDGLRVGLRIQNAGREPMPAGVGFHPFFVRRLWNAADDLALRYAPKGRYPARGMIPTGPARVDGLVTQMQRGPLPVAGLFLDDVFAGSMDGAELHWPASGRRARFECMPSLGHGVVYTGEAAGPRHDFVCFEPVSMVNDGFNLHEHGQEQTGVVELSAGQELAAEWIIRLGTI